MLEKLTEFVGYIPVIAGALFDTATETMTWIMSEPLALIPAVSVLVITGIGVCRKLVKGV
jgi:hypothetical protein